jgi:eukaryotic-like serine/threonine-protein kinase
MLGSRVRGQRPPREVDTQVRELETQLHEVETELYEPGPPPALPPEEPPPSRELWPWLLVLLVLVLAIAAAAYYIANRPERRASPAPTTVAQAPVPAPQVKKSKPKPVKPAGIQVPRLVGMKAPQALSALRRLGLTGEVRGAFSKKPRGVVVGQAPGAGSKVAKDASVELQVSKGPRAVPVPDVVGQDGREAVATLEAVGLKADVADVPSKEQKGLVVAQHPGAGAKAPSGSAVRVNVSAGKPAEKNPVKTKPAQKAASQTQPVPKSPAPAATVAVPDLVGSTLGSARAELRADGLVTEIRRVPSSEPTDTINGQSPRAGTTAKRGDHVFLTVSLGPAKKQAAQTALRLVPTVVGEDQASATADLRAAGFRVAVVDEPTVDATQDGIVIDENPAGGSRAAPGSTVTISVGRSTG